MNAIDPYKWLYGKNTYCDHFKKINDLLISWKETPINWDVI